ncbi:hypothetical protein N7603_06475 [Acholeplasma vituli]|uniref:Uncharacterized protein n=1 Tax=Paracholeplasma vituli TaxID=69473 RepID=A0ABT2PWG5_9MOLU|nr:hypothetical protein [Paracholeplasma vituli]MCU0105300.1 hypothetical protein [Paracholeplasma vituli]
MNKKKALALVEKGDISVGAYLDFREKALSKPYKFKPVRGFKLVFLKGNLLFLTPKIPFWTLRFLGTFIKRIPTGDQVQLESFTLQDILPLLKTIGKNNRLIGVESPKENFLFEIWGV